MFSKDCLFVLFVVCIVIASEESSTSKSSLLVFVYVNIIVVVFLYHDVLVFVIFSIVFANVSARYRNSSPL